MGLLHYFRGNLVKLSSIMLEGERIDSVPYTKPIYLTKAYSSSILSCFTTETIIKLPKSWLIPHNRVESIVQSGCAICKMQECRCRFDHQASHF